jgi:HSP20 family molecular chaperone IbpA
LAIAGFSRVSVTAEQNVVIAGSKAQEAESEFLYGEIASREFKRQISL